MTSGPLPTFGLTFFYLERRTVLNLWVGVVD